MLALYFSSSGVESLRVGLNRAYGLREMRPWWVTRLESIGYVIIAAFSMLTFTFLVAVESDPQALDPARREVQRQHRTDGEDAAALLGEDLGYVIIAAFSMLTFTFLVVLGPLIWRGLVLVAPARLSPTRRLSTPLDEKYSASTAPMVRMPPRCSVSS
jgi:uncharacterized BrkB/YihY/UPF0761 family membrane protein